MKNILIVFAILLFLSCDEQKVIYYEYNDIVVTRIDKGNKIYFYYNKCNNKSIPCSNSYVLATYSGLNSGMNAYLEFKPNKTVDIIRIYGDFEKTGNDISINLINMSNIAFFEWEKNINQNFNNIAEVWDITNLEKKRNLKNNSKVKATYF
ncbi:MAG: hypothetical protein ACPG5B_11405 [Chitinophagales bacterium]